MQRTLDAYVLTRGWRDTSDGVLLTMWLLSDEGPIKVEFSAQRDVMFVERDAPTRPAPPPRFQRKPLALKTLHGADVDGLYFSNRRQLLAERDWLAQQGYATYESDVKPSERFLMERFVAGG
ncbi:MAG TPA: DNA polymerase II, partial [Sorangium sp.]|nr:DNA polymerase II [Sorangium sp.]